MINPWICFLRIGNSKHQRLNTEATKKTQVNYQSLIKKIPGSKEETFSKQEIFDLKEAYFLKRT